VPIESLRAVGNGVCPADGRSRLVSDVQQPVVRQPYWHAGCVWNSRKNNGGNGDRQYGVAGFHRFRRSEILAEEPSQFLRRD
jgi:hypothetical protein